MDQYQQFIHLSRYARWIEEERRRETWAETVDRYINYICDVQCKGKINKTVRKELREAIYSLEVMPSMRALMTAGPALTKDNAANFNCAFLFIDHQRSFSEILYLLMCGVGAAFSVERQYVNKLPEIPDEFYETDTVIVVPDSKIGWAKSLKEIIGLLYAGQIPQWDLSKLRPSGARLKVFGGRSSGPQPLDDLLLFVVKKFKGAAGRKLNSLECHDIVCKIGESVVTGGVRRCLPGSTSVFTPNGVKAIKDIQVGDEIITGGKKAKVLAAGASGVKDTMLIKHRFGQLECTPDHRVAVFGSIMKYEFKPASEIVEGDRLVWDSVGYDGIDTKLPFFKEELHFNSTPFVIPNMSRDVAWLIGLFHGDGYVGEGTLEISGNMQEISFLHSAGVIFKDYFGLESSVGSDGRPGVGARLRVHSAPLSRWFRAHIKQANKALEVPEWIMNSTRDIRFAYLAGLLDADGRVRKDGSIDQATTIYKEFAEDLVIVLASLGIASIISFSSASKRRANGIDAKDFYTVRIVGNTNRKIFVNACQNLSHKLSGKSMKFCGPIDFSFPIRWSNSSFGYKANGNINVISMRYDLPLLPTRVLSVERGKLAETYDIQVEGVEQFTANGLVVHNSACLSLSNLSDDRMRKAKAGQWWETNPQRRLSNNSACYSEKPDVGIFIKEWLTLYESKSGERGIFNRQAAQKQAAKYGRRDFDYPYGTNPCAEIIMRSNSFCNLSEVVIREKDTEGIIFKKLRIATILGTIQATFTSFRFLNKRWKNNCEEERLLGVSLTGIMDHALFSGKEGKGKLQKLLLKMREYVESVNKEWAKKLNITKSHALTCVKPSGTVSQLCNTSSGIHARFSDYYIRTVRANKTDPLAKFMIDAGFPSENDVLSPTNTVVFSFPVKSPENSIFVGNMNAIEQLEMWLIYNDFWCEHKPSCTVYVKEDEWLEVGAWVYKNFDKISGISFLPYSDHIYKQAPYQKITKEEYYEAIKHMPKNIDWKDLSKYELEDNTIASHELACTGDHCEIVDLI